MNGTFASLTLLLGVSAAAEKSIDAAEKTSTAAEKDRDAAEKVVDTADEAAASTEDPKIAYWLHCAGCHGLEGKGAPPEVPTLVDVPGAIAALPGGREYLIRVPGVSQAALSDDRLADVVNYMLTRFSADALNADFKPFSGEEIGRFRGSPLDDPLRTRRELLMTADQSLLR